MEASLFLLFLLFFYSCTHFVSSTIDVIKTNQYIKDGETIISSTGTFEMGFFSPSSSSKRYIGIWYKQILPVLTVVWVANREKPLTNPSSIVLKVTKKGILALINDKNEIIWSTNTSRPVQNPVAVLLDSGNLVVKDANDDNPENSLWQSFDYPTDTLLPDMKLGKNFQTGNERYLSAWNNDADPTPGEYSLHCDPTGYPQNVIKRGTSVSARAGPWNGLRWSGVPVLIHNNIYKLQFVFNKEEVYSSYALFNSSVLSRIVLTNNGFLQRLTWVDRTKSWQLYLNLPVDTCDRYSLCGANGNCDIGDSVVCGCLDKFVAKYPQQWEKGDWSEGCVRRTPLECNKKHVFLKYSGIKLPDTKYFKGVMEGGQEMAVKRLSRTSMQGLGEFKNEVMYIAKLQHRNLVRLLGCCIQGEEKMLIYEFMPNRSLDSFIFDQTKSKLLYWPKRFDIINGIARGLLYLHQDSRLRIIHRDLKASNVLLDIEMTPKISDFGMARSVAGNEMGANISRVVGTHGYMSPEYAVDGIFSVKSDVFSFGVLVLEIVSCKRNRGFFHQDHNLNLLGHAWNLYKEDRSLELIDEQLVDSSHIYQVLRSIQVGLLCVQKCPEDRPIMSSVVLMLANESPLPEAKEPGFFIERKVPDAENSGSQARSSKNEVTITLLEPR